MGKLIRYNLLDTAASMGTLIIGASFGLEAAAISRIAYGLIWIAIYARFMHDLVGFRWSRVLTTYLRSAIVAVATATPALVIYRTWRSPETLGWDGLFVAGIAGLCAWVLALVITRHPAVEDLAGIVRHAFAQILRKPATRAV